MCASTARIWGKVFVVKIFLFATTIGVILDACVALHSANHGENYRTGAIPLANLTQIKLKYFTLCVGIELY
jgi:hypothetical protein